MIVGQREMELSSRTGKKSQSEFDLDLWPVDPEINIGPAQVMVNTSVKYNYCMPKVNGVIMWKWYNILRQNMTWSFDPLTKNKKRSFSGKGQYICEVSSLYAKSKWSRGAETVKSFKSKFDLWPFDLKSQEVLLRSSSTYMWSIIIVCQMEEELWYRNHFFTDGQTHGQTARQPRWKQFTSTTSLAGVYKRIFNVGKSLKNAPPPPWRSIFHGGSNFFTTFGSKFNTKIWPVSAFTFKNDPESHFNVAKNDPGSHFSTGSLFNVTPSARRRGRHISLSVYQILLRPLEVWPLDNVSF